jgi:hypothetical protein
MKNLILLVMILFLEVAIAKDVVKPKTDIIEGPCLVFVDSNKVVQSSPEAAEAGSDVAFYRDAAEITAKKNNLKVVRTKTNIVVFKKVNGSEFILKNTAPEMGEEYLFDGKKDPKKIETLVLFSDGNEYKAYFGKELIQGKSK